MAYRIIALDRIDSSSLPTPIVAGKARWKATVEFWPDAEDGPAPLTDDVILEIPTQGLRPIGGDDWELIPKHEFLANFFDDFLQQLMPAYRQRIVDGARGNMAANDSANQHGLIKADDTIAQHPDVRKIVGKTTATRTDASEIAKVAAAVEKGRT